MSTFFQYLPDKYYIYMKVNLEKYPHRGGPAHTQTSHICFPGGSVGKTPSAM